MMAVAVSCNSVHIRTAIFCDYGSVLPFFVIMAVTVHELTTAASLEYDAAFCEHQAALV